jgi:pimeloyl-ACP methyl ester carboxylesterase
MNPLYLGTRERRLFGIYEPAAGKSARSRAAVLCYPWGPEYVYAHRSMRQLATRLSQSGFHTLRFDFFGTGDSSGELIDADLMGWEDDTASAVDGIKDIADVAQVTLVGLRLGASVAAKAAARLGPQVDSLVLWDPIVSGDEYLRSLGVAAPDDALGAAATEIKGFAMSAAMRKELRTVDLRRDVAAVSHRSLMLVTERLPVHDALQRDGLQTLGAGPVALEFLTAPAPWVEEVTTTGAVPVHPIQRIVEWLA